MRAGGSAKHAIQFGLMAVMAAVAMAFSVTATAGRILLFWTALAFAIVAVAYATGRPSLLLKRQDGSRSSDPTVLLPYFLLVHASLLLYRLFKGRNVAVAEAYPGLWFARRPTRGGLRRVGITWAAVLDLTAEFPRATPREVPYRAIPMLDGAVPTDAQIEEAVDWIDRHLEKGPVLVHCALGHGRTGSVVISWLLRHGHTSDVDSAIAHLHRLRPTFGMSAAQAAALRLRAERVDT